MLQPLYDDDFILTALRFIRGKEIRRQHPPPSAAESIGVRLVDLGMAICYWPIWLVAHIPILSSLLETFVRQFSPNAMGFFLRGAYFKSKLKRMGKNVRISTGVLITDPEKVEIDDYAHIDTYARIEAGNSRESFVKIGKFVHVAGNVTLTGWGGLTLEDLSIVAAGSRLYTAINVYEDPNKPGQLIPMSSAAPFDEQCMVEKAIVIEEYAFIGLNVVILPGVRVGRGSVVGANALVPQNRAIPPLSIAVGTPAKVVKQRAITGQSATKNEA